MPSSDDDLIARAESGARMALELEALVLKTSAALVETRLDVDDLVRALRDAEAAFGRDR